MPSFCGYGAAPKLAPCPATCGTGQLLARPGVPLGAFHLAFGAGLLLYLEAILASQQVEAMQIRLHDEKSTPELFQPQAGLFFSDKKLFA